MTRSISRFRSASIVVVYLQALYDFCTNGAKCSIAGDGSDVRCRTLTGFLLVVSQNFSRDYTAKSTFE